MLPPTGEAVAWILYTYTSSDKSVLTNFLFPPQQVQITINFQFYLRKSGQDKNMEMGMMFRTMKKEGENEEYLNFY